MAVGCVSGAWDVWNAFGHSPAAVPKPNDGVEDVPAPPVGAPAPPNSPPGLGASPSFFPNPPPKPPPKADVVDDAPNVAWPPPNRPPGLLAGVLDAPPPPNRLEDPVLLPPALPNRPPLLGALVVLLFAVPKSEGAPPPVEGVAPKRGLLGALPPPLLVLLPNPKLMFAVVEGKPPWLS